MIALIILSLCFGITAALYLWDEYKLRHIYGDQIEPTEGLVHLYVAAMDEKGMSAVEDTIATLKEVAEVKIDKMDYGLKVKAGRSTVKVFDMALETNEKLKDSRPKVVMVDCRISAFKTYMIFTSFESTPTPYFFNE